MAARTLGFWLTALAAIFAAGLGSAEAAAPEPWQMGLQPSASPIMERVASFHTLLLWIITLICLFVLVLLAYACFRFNENRNPVPSRRSHNTVLEIVWTAVPVLILVIIAVPSFKLLYYQDVIPPTEVTVKAIGKQWFWTYEYPTNGNFTFDALMIDDSDIKPGQRRLLDTDNAVVVPAGVPVKVLVTASDVLHAWTIPAFGVKVDAVPGRLNELWIQVDQPGTYYGQCSELCGVRHAYMPITLRALPRAEFDAWVQDAQKKFARVDESVRVAEVKAPAAVID